MHRASARFHEAVRRPHTIASKVEVIEPTTNEVLAKLPVTGGYVTIDAQNEIRRRGRAVVIDYEGEYTPTDLNSMLVPGTNFIRLSRGIDYYPEKPGTDVEYVPLGTLVIADSEVSDSREGINITVAGFDFARKVARNRLVNPYVVPANTYYPTAIAQMVKDFSPLPVVFDIDPLPSTIVTPKLVFGADSGQGGGNPWKYATEMAESVGMELSFDPLNICKIGTRPSIHNPVTETYEEGPEGILLYVNRRYTDEDTRNFIVVTGESTSNEEPVRAIARDDNVYSPTYYLGPFGKVPGFFQSRFIRTEEQAQLYANALLQQRLAINESARIITVVHPGHHPGDVIEVKRARSKTDKKYVLRNLTIPLSAGESLTLVMQDSRF